MSMTSQPTDCSADSTTRWNSGPETRLSRPTTIRLEPPRCKAHAPNPAAYRAITSGVNASPTRPRIPDTPIINPSCDIRPPSGARIVNGGLSPRSEDDRVDEY